MSKGYLNNLFEHVARAWVCLLVVAAVFVCGTCAGAYCVRLADAEELEELSSYVSVFVGRLGSADFELSPLVTFYASVAQVLRTIFFVWLLGVTVVGIPAVWAAVFVRGFASGFSVAFLAEEMGVGGVVFAACAILPQSLFLVSGLVLAGTLATWFSWRILQQRKAGRKMDFLGEFMGYTSLFAACAALSLLGSLVEGWITPLLMKVGSSFIAR
ncbi:MAG: stage II sporulation protein M [Bacillota bacterium]